jgi:type II secretion system protein D
VFDKKVQHLIVYAALATASVCALAAEEPNNLSFDPFGGETVLSAAINTSETGPVIPQVEFTNSDITDAFGIISDVSGWSIFPTAEVSKAKVTFWAKDVTARQVLDTVVAMAGFTYHREGNIITVTTYEEYMQYYGLDKKVIPVKYADAASIANVLKPFLTKLARSVVHSQTNTFILYESQANLEFLTAVIERLDAPSEAVGIEVVNLKYAECASLAKTLQDIFVPSQAPANNKSQTTAPSEAAAQTNAPADRITDTTGDQNAVFLHDRVDIFAVEHANQLLIVGTNSNIRKVLDVVALVDVCGDNMILDVIELEFADAEELANTLQELFPGSRSANQQNGRPGISPRDTAAAGAVIDGDLMSPSADVEIRSVGRTNQLIIKAFRNDIEKLMQLIAKLDTYREPSTQNYHFTYIDASEIYTGLERILDVSNRSGFSGRGSSRNSEGDGGNGRARSGTTLIERTNSIVVTGPPSVHRIMTSIKESIDVPAMYESGIIRVYKIENADLEEVAQTLRDLIQTDGEERERSPDVQYKDNLQPSGDSQADGDLTTTDEFVPQVEAKVSTNKATNSVVVQATPQQHRQLEKLIAELDKRRKQVLIKAMIAEVITDDNLDLGVELSYLRGDAREFTFFGLTNPESFDPDTGFRAPALLDGGTVVIDPDQFQAVIHALKTDVNTRITSSPQILVNDNAVGGINNVAEAPITQFNQGEVAATTSFAGFVEAGTQFAITPHISDSNYLRVEYTITLSAFMGKSTDETIPPPRTTSNIQSEATIPNGYTIVVGGLRRTDEIEDTDKVPLLGDIPLLGAAFRRTTIQNQYTKIYLFITPQIMEHEGFSDLKSVSDKALEHMRDSGHVPANSMAAE